MEYKIMVVQEFAAAHRLNRYPGNCRNIHGHTWRVELIIGGTQLDDLGMLVDFRRARQVLTTILQRFDHQMINEVSPFDEINPTAENLAHYIYDQASQELPGYSIKTVRVWESNSTWASYGGND
ncbi:6-carboxytetrahydropterin synthase QueD [Syntrophomonas erecta]